MVSLGFGLGYVSGRRQSPRFSFFFFLERSAVRSGWSMLVEQCSDESVFPSRSPEDIV